MLPFGDFDATLLPKHLKIMRRLAVEFSRLVSTGSEVRPEAHFFLPCEGSNTAAGASAP
jgi:hypothetical protein